MPSSMLCFLALASILSAGCYAPAYVRTVHVFGDVDLSRDEQIAERAGALPWHGDYSKVRVLAGKLPEGLAM